MLNYVNLLILKGKVKCLNLKENKNILPPSVKIKRLL